MAKAKVAVFRHKRNPDAVCVSVKGGKFAPLYKSDVETMGERVYEAARKGAYCTLSWGEQQVKVGSLLGVLSSEGIYNAL